MTFIYSIITLKSIFFWELLIGNVEKGTSDRRGMESKGNPNITKRGLDEFNQSECSGPHKKIPLTRIGHNIWDNQQYLIIPS